jgi:hypothetical protein
MDEEIEKCRDVIPEKNAFQEKKDNYALIHCFSERKQ